MYKVTHIEYRVCLIEKLMYFVHTSNNPMDSNPKHATPCRYSLVKTYSIVIHLFLSAEMRSPLAFISNIVVMFSVHGNYMSYTAPGCIIHYRFLICNRYHDIMTFKFTYPKIVTKSLFPIFMIKKKHQTPSLLHYLGGLLFFTDILYHENMFHHNFVGFTSVFHHAVLYNILQDKYSKFRSRNSKILGLWLSIDTYIKIHQFVIIFLVHWNSLGITSWSINL